MSITGWRPADDEVDPHDDLGFDGALAELAVKDASEIDPVDVVRKSREDVWLSSST